MRISTLAAVIAFALSTALGSAAADELRLSAQPFPSYAPIFLAKKKGWLDKELSKVGAPTATLATFAAGLQDFGFLGDTPVIIGKGAGLEPA